MRILIFLLSCLCILACSSDSASVAGTATDTENMLTASVSGVVTKSDGAVALRASVRMARMPLSDDSSSKIDFVEVFTDSTGAFSFDSLVSDTFQIAVVDTSAGEISYIPRLTLEKGGFEKIQLSKASVFRSVVYYEEPVEPTVAVGSHFELYMPGMPFTASVFAGDSFTMLIPSGSWWFGFCPGDPQIIAKLEDSGVADSLIYRVWNMDSLNVEAGDTLDVGPFLWSTEGKVDSLMNEPAKVENKGRLVGTVACGSKGECAQVEVMLLTDLYGFSFVDGDSSVFVRDVMVDSSGYFELPLPEEVPMDSFRVEFRYMRDGIVKKTGLSRYVLAREVESLSDTVDLGESELVEPSGLVSSVTLVIDQTDSTQSNNCMVNSVVVGVKGTAHFVRAVTCNSLSISNLPSGPNELVLYSGDPKVVSTLMDAGTPIEEYVVSTFVSLPKSKILEWQGMTYTPPTLK